MATKREINIDLAARENPCPVCGSTQFSWGVLTRAGGYKPYDTSLINLAGLLLGGLRLEARLCGNCGNVQQFIEVPESRKKKNPAIEQKDYFTWLEEQKDSKS